jgi:hypothetical protein
LSDGGRLVDQVLAERVVGWVTFGKGQFGISGGFLKRHKRNGYFRRVNVRAAAALEMGFLG